MATRSAQDHRDAATTTVGDRKEHAWEQQSSRNMLFVSHANPEDNTFTMWLALRLAREGYPVWCDLTKLLGGETFWRDIEIAVRARTAKFLFVLSRSSNAKDGALNELDLAVGVERRDKLADFVIPLRIDDLSHGDINIQIRRKNAIDFSHSWATGLVRLLEKLSEHRVPTDSRFAPTALNEWWRQSHSGNDLLIDEPDSHLSNWFPIEELPAGIYVHTLRSDSELRGSAWTLAQPAHRIGEYIVSFAPRSDFDGLVSASSQIALDHALERNDSSLPLTARQFRNSTVHLLRLAWDRVVAQRGLPTQSLSRKRSACYFAQGTLKGSRVSFTLPDGFSGSRILAGYKTVWSAASRKKVRRYWHYGMSADARLSPHPVIILNAHVFFSDDGRAIWDSAKRLHTARRSLGGGWWNDDWRDRLLAATAWIADGEDYIALPVSSTDSIRMSRAPVTFDSALSYRDNFARHADPTEIVFDDAVASVGANDGESADEAQEEAG